MRNNAVRKFTDNKDRKIIINDEIVAYHGEREVGSISLGVIDGELGQIHNVLLDMNVIEGYKNAGIGTELMRVTAKFYGKDFLKPGPDDTRMKTGSSAQSHTYYTPEGEALVNSCIRKRILAPTPNIYGGIGLDVLDEWEQE